MCGLSRWEICVSLTESGFNQAQMPDMFGNRCSYCSLSWLSSCKESQRPRSLSSLVEVSFVNSICTIRGGTHVTHVSDQIVEAGSKQIQADHIRLARKSSMYRSQLFNTLKPSCKFF